MTNRIYLSYNLLSFNFGYQPFKIIPVTGYKLSSFDCLALIPDIHKVEKGGETLREFMMSLNKGLQEPEIEDLVEVITIIRSVS